MGYFPFFINVEGVEGLVIGGGDVAARKVRALLSYGARLTVVAPTVCAELSDLAASVSGLRLVMREAREEDLGQARFCLVATDNLEQNAFFRGLCEKKGIPVNVAAPAVKTGSPEAGSSGTALYEGGSPEFLFPALVRRGAMTVAVSTEGNSPAAAAWAKGRIEEALPPRLGDMVALMGSLRAPVRESLHRQEDRAACFSQLWKLCLENLEGEGMTARELESACLARLAAYTPDLGETDDEDQNRNQG